MKILFISYEYQPIKTPQSIRWKNILENLCDINENAEINIFTKTHNKNPFHDQSFISNFEKKIYADRRINKEQEQEQEQTKNKQKNKKQYILKIKEKIKEKLPLDASLWWAFKTRKNARAICSKVQPNIIITSAPPFGSLVVGYFLKKYYKNNIKWIIDLGDPWSFASDRKLSKPIFKIIKKIESVLINKCDGLVLTTNATLKKYKSLGILKRQIPVLILPQGFSPLSSHITINTEVKNDLVYTGRFYEKIREPFELYSAVKSTNRKLIIAGNHQPEFQPSLENTCITSLGNLPHEEAMKLQLSASVLIYIDNKDSTQLPGKIFEYLATYKPILCIGSSTNSPIHEINFGSYPIYFCNNKSKSISDALMKISTFDSTAKASSKLPHRWEDRAIDLNNFLIKI